MASFIGSSKLKDALKYLLEIDHHLPDDTLLNRLLDLIHLYVAVDNFESTGLKWFLEKISINPSKIEPSVLTFSLSLCGKLSEKEAIIEKYLDVVTNLLDQIKPMIKDSSIATAYFECLTSMVTCKHGLQYINQNEDYPNILLDRMKNGGSMFVRNAASTLVYTLLNLPEESKIVTLVTLSESLLTDFDALSKNTSKSKNMIYRPTSCILSLFYKLGDSVNWKRNIHADYIFQVSYSCLKLYQTLPASYAQLLSDVIVKFFKMIDGDNREEFTNKVEDDVKQLVKVDVVKYHHVACNLIQICSRLKDVVSMPSDIILNRNNDYLNTKSLISKTVLSSIIVQYLSCANTTDNINEQIELIIKCIKIIQDKDDHQYKHYLLSNKSLLSKILHNLKCKLELETCIVLKEEKFYEIYQLLLDAISAISTDITTLKSGTSCMLIILSKLNWKELDLTQFIRILEMKLCDTGWEIRDTALEIINQLVSIVKDDDEYKVVLPLCCIGWSSRTDSNSYVRASVLTLISTIVTQQSLLYQFRTSLNVKIEDITNEVTTILKEDSEAFPRRAAVKTLDDIYRTCNSPDCQVDICCAMLHAMEDFDWEVKILVLKFWEDTTLNPLTELVGDNRVQNNLPSYASGLPESLPKKEHLNVSHLVSKEFCRSLLLGYNDYEQSVKERACVMIERFLKIWMNKTNVENECSKDLMTWIDKLQCLNIETSIDYNSDEYSKNPISLLEDILATAGEQDEDNFVDCY